MRTLQFAMNAASMKGWPVRQEPNGDLRVEIQTQPGRTQVVNVTMAKDGDGDAAAFVWSKAGTLYEAGDLAGFLRHNMTLTYGKVAIRGNELLVVHALFDGTAELAEVGKTLYWVARAADELERNITGGRDAF